MLRCVLWKVMSMIRFPSSLYIQPYANGTTVIASHVTFHLGWTPELERIVLLMLRTGIARNRRKRNWVERFAEELLVSVFHRADFGRIRPS